MTKLIKNIRMSPIIPGINNREWLRQRSELTDYLMGSGYYISDDNIMRLSGGLNTIQSHIKDADAYLFFGKLNIDQMVKLCSLFVGIQTLDPKLHIEGDDGIIYRKPIIMYDPQIVSRRQSLFIAQLELLFNKGTIRELIEKIIRRPRDLEELYESIVELIEPDKVVHGHKVSIGQKTMYEIGDFTHTEAKRPDYVVCVFTSARKAQDEISTNEGYTLGRELSKKGWGLITGLGAVGLMKAVHMGSVENGGWAAGSNCPHIMMLEGIPEGSAESWIKPDIYERMVVMIANSNAVIISGGGRGGAGTFQEALACIMLMTRNSVLMKSADHNEFKPLIIDNRLEMWGPLVEIAKDYGLIEGKHFHVVSGTEKAIEIIAKICSGEIKPAYHYERVRATSTPVISV